MTDDNKAEYIRQKIESVLVRQRSAALATFKEGFEEALGKLSDLLPQAIATLTPSELHVLACGEQIIFPAQVLELITFEHFPPDSPVPDWIRGVIGQKSSDWLKRFLMFATAQPVLPRQAGRLKFIALRHADPGRLPQSHTCFLTVDVPLYTSEEQMATKLERAIIEKGFGIE